MAAKKDMAADLAEAATKDASEVVKEAEMAAAPRPRWPRKVTPTWS